MKIFSVFFADYQDDNTKYVATVTDEQSNETIHWLLHNGKKLRQLTRKQLEYEDTLDFSKKLDGDKATEHWNKMVSELSDPIIRQALLKYGRVFDRPIWDDEVRLS